MDALGIYKSIEGAVDVPTALLNAYQVNGDAVFTADKRVAEAFFTRGRHRSLNQALFTDLDSTKDAFSDERDADLETDYKNSILKGINTLLESKIKEVEKLYGEFKSRTNNIDGLVLDLKVAYAFILFKILKPGDLTKISSPNINPFWREVMSVDSIEKEMKPMEHFAGSMWVPERYENESDLIYLYRKAIEYERYKILDELAKEFKSSGREDLVKEILSQEFRFINETTTGIVDKYNINRDMYRKITKARTAYIASVKISLNLAQKIVQIASTTYRRRSAKIKGEFLDVGQEINADKSIYTEFILNNE